MKKSKKKLIIGIILMFINLYSIIIEYNHCISNNETHCSIFQLDQGIMYFLGHCSFLITGLVLIALYIIDNKPKKVIKTSNFQDKYSSLKQLKELLDKKIITEDEFKKEKEKILKK